MQIYWLLELVRKFNWAQKCSFFDDISLEKWSLSSLNSYFPVLFHQEMNYFFKKTKFPNKLLINNVKYLAKKKPLFNALTVKTL